MNLNKFTKVAGIIAISIYLSGCAVSKMLMAGYTPPKTIADLMNEQYGLAGELPPELQDNDGQSQREINLGAYKGAAESSQPSQVQYVQASNMNARLYRPSFTFKGVEDYAAQLTKDLIKHSVGLTPNMKIGVSSFVKLDESLQNTTILGNQLSEHFISQLQRYGLAVIDHKLMPALKVTSRGDIAFSRSVVDLSSSNKMDHVLSGTMIEKPEGVFVNARIISIHDNRVVASAHLEIPDFVVASSQGRYVRR